MDSLETQGIPPKRCMLIRRAAMKAWVTSKGISRDRLLIRYAASLWIGHMQELDDSLQQFHHIEQGLNGNGCVKGKLFRQLCSILEIKSSKKSLDKLVSQYHCVECEKARDCFSNSYEWEENQLLNHQICENFKLTTNKD